jgi:hypothetical protein
MEGMDESRIQEHRSDRIGAIWFLVLVVAGTLLYLPGLNGAYYADDFILVFDSPGSQLFTYFTTRLPNMFYRPLQGFFLALVQGSVGLDTIPIHVTQLLLHCLLCGLLYLHALESGMPRPGALFGSFFMLFSQANVLAVANCDTLSQVLGTLAGCLALYVLDPHRIQGSCPPGGLHGETHAKRAYITALLLYVVSLLSKESSVAFLPLLLFLYVISVVREGDRAERMRRTLLGATPFVLVTIAYVVMRDLAGSKEVAFGVERYDIRLGLNVPRNLVMLFFASTAPFSSVDVFQSFQLRDAGEILLFGLGTLLVTGFVVYGIVRGRRRGVAVFWIASAIVTLVPVVPLNHVSELYTYNAMPFVALLFGLAFGTHLALAAGRKRRKLVVWGAALILLVGLGVFARQKIMMVKRNGEEATRLLKVVTKYVEMVPKNGELLLVNPPSDRPEYSVFAMNGFSVLDYAEQRIRRITNRPDISIQIVNSEEVGDVSQSPGTVAVTWEQVAGR